MSDEINVDYQQSVPQQQSSEQVSQEAKPQFNFGNNQFQPQLAFQSAPAQTPSQDQFSFAGSLFSQPQYQQQNDSQQQYEQQEFQQHQPEQQQQFSQLQFAQSQPESQPASRPQPESQPFQLDTRPQAPSENTNSSEDTIAAQTTADARSVYIGNVDYALTPLELQQHFSESGVVERVTILTNKLTGRPKGFAYLEFTTIEGAHNAVANQNGTMFRGRELKVNLKRTNIPGVTRGRGGPRGRGFFRGGRSRGVRGRGFRGGARFSPY